MGARKSSEKDDLEGQLLSLPAQDLRFLCAMFRLPRGGSKADLVETLLDSQYSAEEIARPALELLFGLFVEAYVPKDHWAYVLESNELASSGSRHDLLLLLVENGLLEARGTLEALSPTQLRDVYYNRFSRVPTTNRESTISQILESFGFGSRSVKSVTLELPKPKAGAEFEYDIALSFAGEDRSIARKIASGLKSRGVRVFMDEFERTQLWGRDLSDELRSRYGEKTRFVVLLVSAHYAIKDWTDFEFAIARKEAGRRSNEFILPVRLDDTPLPGLRSSIAYLSLKEFGVDGIVDEIIRKLNLP
ncbi:MAG: hypothetical protein AUG74_04930 [Bacteroidetes bacterium 13_1_20CM_4_60_6]|nr:MAG: hypothetical protein AUG74_04930 [Bacteroidetes bacterium 13_1_20CM_4_60_6]